MDKINMDLLQKKRFKVKFTVMTTNGLVLPLDTAIRRIRITNDFTNNVMPEYRVIMNLPPEIILQIQEDYDKVVFEMEVQSRFHEEELNSEKAKTEAERKRERLFDPFMGKTLLKPLLSDKGLLYVPPARGLDDDSESNGFKNIRYEMILVPVNSLQSNKGVDSGVLRNATVTEALLVMASKAKTKLYLSPPDNNTRYDQIVLYPGNLYSNMYHINNNYGIYKDDIKIYSNEDMVIVGPMSKGTSMDRGTVNIQVNFPRNKGDNIQYGSYDALDPEGSGRIKNMVVNSNNVAITDNSALASELSGSRQHVTNRTIYGLDENMYYQDHLDRDGVVNKARVYENVYSNSYALESFIKNNTKPRLVTINYKDVDIKPMDAYKRFHVKFDDHNYSRYNAKYKCIGMTTEFEMTNRNHCTISGLIKLRYEEPDDSE